MILNCVYAILLFCVEFKSQVMLVLHICRTCFSVGAGHISANLNTGRPLESIQKLCALMKVDLTCFICTFDLHVLPTHSVLFL